MKKPLGVAIAGVGFIGQVHVRAARAAGAEVIGVAGLNAQRTRATADAVQVECVYTSPEELASDPNVDVVHICTPNNTHASLARLALSNGKHVICEKPLATSVDAAASIANQAREAGLLAAVPFVYRFHPMVLEARHRVAHQLGALRLVHGSYQQDWLASPDSSSWRVDPKIGGPSQAFADIGSHWCDLVEFVTGHRIVRLNAKTHTTVRERNADSTEAFSRSDSTERVEVHGDDAITMMFETDNGAHGTLLISQVSWGRKNRLFFELDGANEAISFNQEESEHLWIGKRDATEMLWRDPHCLSPQAAHYATLPAGHAQGFESCFDAFVADAYAAIKGSVSDVLPLFSDGLRAAQITQTVLDSAKSETWKEVPKS